MTEPHADPAPEVLHATVVPTEPAAPDIVAPIPEPRRGTPLWLTLLLALILAGGLFAVWLRDNQKPDTARFAALEADLRTAQQHLADLEQRPAPKSADIAPLEARTASIEGSLKNLAARPQVETSALEQRLATIEKRPVPDVSSEIKAATAGTEQRLTALDGRLATIEQRPVPDVAKDVQVAVAGASAAIDAKITTLDGKLKQDQQQSTARAAETTRLRNASSALEQGQPLGDVPNAPASVTKFATQPPPTLPALRQSFARYAAAAASASQPSPEGHSFAERMWMRAQGLVTVRQGDHVMVGAPAAVTLEAARGKLDAGDLAGALAALAPLDGPAAAAIAPWRNDAQALLDARAALAALAAKS